MTITESVQQRPGDQQPLAVSPSTIRRPSRRTRSTTTTTGATRSELEPSGEHEFNITNDSAADTDIIIAGGILNSAGAVNIRNIGGGGGDILGNGVNSWINARGVTLMADSGFVGTANNRVNLRIPLDRADFPGPSITGASATAASISTSTGAGSKWRPAEYCVGQHRVGARHRRPAHPRCLRPSTHRQVVHNVEDKIEFRRASSFTITRRPSTRHHAAQRPGAGDARRHLGRPEHQDQRRRSEHGGTSRPTS